MAKANIIPEMLKKYRKSTSLSQQSLADVSGVSKKTIARIETGKSSANTNTAKRLAKALEVQPEMLSRQPDHVDENESKRTMRLFGYRARKALVQENTELAFQMVEKCYGISPAIQISPAPLLAALLAEESLAWRRKKVQEAEQAISTLIDADYGHRTFMAGIVRKEDGIGGERESIERRDVFGEIAMDNAVDNVGVDPDSTDPFTEYLRH